jgi:hypothetical protein
MLLLEVDTKLIFTLLVDFAPSAMATGQAAGTAASLALDSKVNPADINIKQLQKELLKDDVVPESFKLLFSIVCNKFNIFITRFS